MRGAHGEFRLVLRYWLILSRYYYTDLVMPLSKNERKFLAHLKHRKNRARAQRLLLEGATLVRHACQVQPQLVEKIWIVEDFIPKGGNIAPLCPVPLSAISRKEAERISSFKTPAEIFALIRMPTFEKEDMRITRLALFLDGVQDPGNVGTILRTMDWFGWRPLFLSPDSADVFNPKALRASMGSALTVPSFRMSWKDLRNRYPQIPCLVADTSGTRITHIDTYRFPLLLVIGNEGHGVQPAIRASANGALCIPPSSQSHADSLNAAVATAILCYDIWVKTRGD